MAAARTDFIDEPSEVLRKNIKARHEAFPEKFLRLALRLTARICKPS